MHLALRLLQNNSHQIKEHFFYTLCMQDAVCNGTRPLKNIVLIWQLSPDWKTLKSFSPSTWIENRKKHKGRPSYLLQTEITSAWQLAGYCKKNKKKQTPCPGCGSIWASHVTGAFNGKATFLTMILLAVTKHHLPREKVSRRLGAERSFEFQHTGALKWWYSCW